MKKHNKKKNRDRRGVLETKTIYKSISFYATFGDRTGYQVHATNLCNALEKLMPVYRNQPGGDVSISLIDSVSIQNVNERLPYPSLLYNIWESTEQPQWFMDKLKYFDGLLVGREWQRACSIAQGIPEEFVKVVPEGVDPDVYKPSSRMVEMVVRNSATLDFLVCGQWQPRKSTLEIVQSFLRAFPDSPNVRLYLSTDTLFPSDTYNSTEERLVANSISDSRIIPVHFEERGAYIRRLQQTHCHVSCSRAEGWGLPIIESMACGVPTIVCDYSGSTEYAQDAIKIPVREMIKPFGIYGDWQVPGMWGSPDYDHLVEVMRDVYENYAIHKKKALKTSEMIRTKFSWAAAAQEAYNIIQSLRPPVNNFMSTALDAISSRNAIFTVDCHPTSQARMDTLVETVTQIREFGYPVLVVSHCPLPSPIVELFDYYIYDKRNILSGDDKPIYGRQKADGTIETTQASIPCHALAALHNVRNAIDFCLGKYDWIYHMNSDVEVDLKEWLSLVYASKKPLIATHWDNDPHTFGGQIIAGKTEFMNKIMPRLSTWDEFAEMFGNDRFCSERGFYKIVAKEVGLESVEFLSIELGNRFDQVDRDAWNDEQFQCNFIDGPFLNIIGLSNREYDVIYSNPIDGNNYSLKQKTGMWSRSAKKFYRDWTIRACLNGEEKFCHHIDLSGQNVIISMGSKAMGDTFAWIPYVEEFRKKHNCNVYCSSWWNNILDYPDIHFVKPGSVVNDVYASYQVGCYDDQPNMNPLNWRTVPLQKVAADILGLDYRPLRVRLKYEPNGVGDKPKPYICFSEFSTMQNKFWNRPGAWQNIVDYLNSIGYDCVSISAEPSQLRGIIKHNGQSIEQTLTDIAGAEFYVGLNHGPSWIAYALGKPCIMITGVSEEWNDFPNPHRVSVDVCRPGCFNDPNIPIDRSWAWCPCGKDYACTREITEGMVIEQIRQAWRALFLVSQL